MIFNIEPLQKLSKEGHSHKAIAARLGCHPSYITLILNGRRIPRPRTLAVWAEKLGIGQEEWFSDRKESS